MLKFLRIEVLLAPVGALTPLIVKPLFFLSLMKRSSTFSEATAKLILGFTSRGSGLIIPSAPAYIPSLASVLPFNSIQSPNL